jgi:hypothetical protein
MQATRCSAISRASGNKPLLSVRVLKARASRPVIVVQAAAVGGEISDLSDSPLIEIVVDGKMAELPAVPGIYAVFDKESTIQYIGLSRKVLDISTAFTSSLMNSETHTLSVYLTGFSERG